MPVKIVAPTPSAYTYPLLIKHLLHSPMTRAPDQEIVYRDLRRRTFREFRERVGDLRAASPRSGSNRAMSWPSSNGTAIATTNATSPFR